ncbi:MAG: pyruvate, phosphate dikinase [Candidatus Omnitrophica bacterium]|jgi:pyruvate,orthophosphate dikinase|nr:pyruvate, phosphate dikinase [Candidatus Omnitrophota bacterium]
MANKKKYVYFFSKGKSDGNATMKELLGGKGANLAEMSSIGLPVPPGFTITTEVCKFYYDNNRKYPSKLNKEVEVNLKKLEKETGKKFGDKDNPLLVSVRSGAAASMPGMMDTILNLGLTDEAVEGMIRLTNNPRFAWDSYRRFIQMFGDVAMEVPHEAFEHELEEIKRKIAAAKNIKDANNLVQEALNKVVPDTALGVEDLKELVKRYKTIYKKYTNSDFPQEPIKQLWCAINAVFGSWNNERAVAYRQINNIKGLMGTAVNVQTMVFGNMGEDSGTGVGFTRDPSTGDNKLYGEFLMNAQGEDVVAGIRTPLHISDMKKSNRKIYDQLQGIRNKLEKHYKEMQDFEFTIERKILYILQTRNGKRTAQAAVKIAVDMVKEKLINKLTAVMRIKPEQIEQLLHPNFDTNEEKKALIFSKAGLPASPGAAVGQAVFTAKDAESWKEQGKEVILCRLETSPEDIRGMHAASGILTVRGGMTSHAAVVARGWGKCCVAGAGDIIMDLGKKQMHSGGQTISEGDWISLNGSKGVIYLGRIKTIPAEMTGPFGVLMKWSDEIRRLGIRTNADTPSDAAIAIKFGAEGIGLCRTEHMFFEGERITSFRKMILVAPKVKDLRDKIKKENDKSQREALEAKLQSPLRKYREALNELLPLQRKDFEGIFEALKGYPCTIRFLDPPLHEFLPQDEKGQQQLANLMGVDYKSVKDTVESLHEFNPMLGHRGCRLGITYPEITEMQAEAVLEAALAVTKRNIKVQPEIMIPLVGNIEELKLQKDIVSKTIEKIIKDKKLKKLPFDIKIGTMIEVPRAAVTADEIAKVAEFFSFGTNDLTQMGCGFSRDDAGRFLGDYVELGIYDTDPFQSLDTKGVGKLIKIAVDLGKKTRKNIKLGICGEHGGDPASVEFCHKVGLNYVSCSPYRVPVARLAAAQSVIKEKSKSKK